MEYRRPLYEEIAAARGYTVTAAAAETVRDEQDFIDLVASAIGAEVGAVA